MEASKVYPFFFGMSSLLGLVSNAQYLPCLPQPNVLDAAYKNSNNYPHIIPYVYVREADVMWSKRVWRKIDLREKINLPLYYPLQPGGDKMSVFDVIKCAVLHGEIQAYAFNPADLDDCFTLRLTKTETENEFLKEQTTKTEFGNDTTLENPVTSEDIRQYMLKEDWFFDKQRSVLDVRIIAICPLKATYNTNTGKEEAGIPPTSMFWVYYPSLRLTFAMVKVHTSENDVGRLTIEQVFTKRYFSSFVVQESNVYDRTISSYIKNMDALIESDKITENIRNIESDMWQY